MLFLKDIFRHLVEDIEQLKMIAQKKVEEMQKKDKALQELMKLKKALEKKKP